MPMSEEQKKLPPAAIDDQVKVETYRSIRESPFKETEGTKEMRARTGNNDDDTLYMQIKSSEDAEYVIPGIESYQAIKKLTNEDLKDENWEPENHESVRDVPSPTYDEMDELKSKYEDRLKDAETKEKKEEVLEEMWEEAADMELDGRDPIGVKK